MALVLVATPGAANANSYATAAEGDSYHEGHLYSSSWTAATLGTKETALVMATRLLDRNIVWKGVRTNDVQALEWPRQGMVARNLYTFIDNSVVPPEIKEVTSELARLLIQGDRTAELGQYAQGLKAFSAGPVSFTFRDGEIKLEVMPDSVIKLIPALWVESFPRKPSTLQLSRT